MNREQLFERVPLRPLSRDEVQSYIHIAANAEPARELVDRIYEETEGNPFFLSAVVDLMAEEGTLARGYIGTIAIPEGVSAALGRRLDRLSRECNDLLRVAAVAGRDFSHELLAAVSDAGDEALLDLVDEALEARVIEEAEAPGSYRFTHALMQESLLAELTTVRRVRLHGRIAEALETLFASSAEGHAVELAHHFAEAALVNHSHAERAVQYSKIAAQRALTESAWEEAARHFEQCLGLVADGDHDDGDIDVDVLLGLALSAANAADFETARRSVDRATDLLESLG